MNKTYTLENAFAKIAVSPIGAEIQSLYSKETDMEYLWQPGAETWPHHSMLLLPNPGRIAGDRTIIGGQDESYRHTRWGRVDNRYFVPCDWLTAWQGTFRYVTLGMIQDWDILR